MNPLNPPHPPPQSSMTLKFDEKSQPPKLVKICLAGADNGTVRRHIQPQLFCQHFSGNHNQCQNIQLGSFTGQRKQAWLDTASVRSDTFQISQFQQIFSKLSKSELNFGKLIRLVVCVTDTKAQANRQANSLHVSLLACLTVFPPL